MKNWIRLFLTMGCFFCEVTVKAALFSDYPANCSAKRELSSLDCSVKTNKPYVWKVDGYKVYLSSDSLLKYEGLGKFFLVKGKVWIKAEDEVLVKTPFGQAQITKGDLYVVRSKNSSTFKALKQSVNVTPKGDESFLLEPGFEISLTHINGRGVASYNFPSVISLTSHIKEWSDFYPSRQENFTEDVNSLGKTVTKAISRAQEINSWLFDSRVSYLTQEHSKKVREKQNQRDYNNALIKLFRKKSNYE